MTVIFSDSHKVAMHRYSSAVAASPFALLATLLISSIIISPSRCLAESSKAESIKDPRVETAVAERLSAEEAVARALAENRELKAVRLTVAEAKGRLLQVSLVANPEIEVAQSSTAALGEAGDYGLSAKLLQPLPISGRLTYQAAVARAELALAEAEVANRERQLTGEVLQGYFGVVLVERKQRLHRELREGVQQLVDASERRFKVAEIAAAELEMQRLELQRIRTTEQLLAVEHAERAAQLARLLGGQPEQLIVDPEQLPKVLPREARESAIVQAKIAHPEIVAMQLQGQRAAHQVKLARAERWEDWKVGVEYRRDKGVFADPIGTQRDNFLGFSLSVPLPLWDRNQGKLDELSASENRLEAELLATTERVLSEARASSAKLTSLQPIVSQVELVSLPLAQQNLVAVQRSYTAGLVGIPALLQAQQQLAEVQQSYLELLESLTSEQIRFLTITASTGVAS